MNKLVSTITILAAAGTLACAQEFVDATTEATSESHGPVFANYISAQGFFAQATEDAEGEHMKLAGPWFTAGRKTVLDNGLILDCAGILAVGWGSMDYEKSNYNVDLNSGWLYDIINQPSGDETIKDKFEYEEVDIFLGAQIGLDYAIFPSFIIGAGVMGGVDIRFSSFEYSAGEKYSYASAENWNDSDDDDVAFGFFVGAYVHADWAITEHWSLIASGRYLYSTTKSEFYSHAYYDFDFDYTRTGFFLGTVGVKYSF